jgi:23S rRNA (cytosine1962-C5)-methyltransferase
VKFVRLRDDLLSVLYEDKDILAIDKPYGFNAHTNDSKIEHTEYIQDGLIEIFEKQLGKKLHIVHRLDQTTTGVMIFGKSVESAKKYADYFFERKVKKTYFFVTKKRSMKTNIIIDQVIIHKGKELDAKTHFSLIKKSDLFELWQAHPFTGRNHQIRIHAHAAELSILGDEKYGGEKFPFLFLHNHQIEFPSGVDITSELPAYFTDLSLLSDLTLTKALFNFDRRRRLFGQLSDYELCLRLVHNLNNSIDPGYTIDKFGKLLIINLIKENWNESYQSSFKKLSKIINQSLLIQNQNTLEQQSCIVKEGIMQFEVRFDSGPNVGLPLNQRLHRNWVLNNVKQKSVLNLFSNTGYYGVAAALGGANDLTLIDLNKNNLSWSKKNFELNSLDLQKCKFLCRDSLLYLEQAIKKKLKFNTIICDSPSFYRREKGIFKIEKDLEKLLSMCFECLEKQGELLFLTNYDNFYIDDLRKLFHKVKSNIEIKCILPSLDFELPNEKTNLKSFLIKSVPSEV